MDIFDVYRKSGDSVKRIYRSRLLTEILFSLNEDSKTLSQLREITGSTSQAIIPKLRQLESDQLIGVKENRYFLTDSGKIVASRIVDSFMTMATINRHKSFLSDHYLEGIPDSLLKEIGCLYNCDIVSDTKTEIFNIYNTNLKIIKEAEYILGVSSVLTEGYADSILERVYSGIPVELIVPADVGDLLKQKPYDNKIRSLEDYKNFKLSVMHEDIKFGLIVSDKCMSLSLYNKDAATYDIRSCLFSSDPMAVGWAQRLFGYWKERSNLML
ncbi:MAG: DUF1724 domain-containing protein [Methanolobus sp.]|nr:DUF1724 domain-containing protein [Methanolobus sp.]